MSCFWLSYMYVSSQARRLEKAGDPAPIPYFTLEKNLPHVSLTLLITYLWALMGVHDLGQPGQAWPSLGKPGQARACQIISIHK